MSEGPQPVAGGSIKSKPAHELYAGRFGGNYVRSLVAQDMIGVHCRDGNNVYLVEQDGEENVLKFCDDDNDSVCAEIDILYILRDCPHIVRLLNIYDVGELLCSETKLPNGYTMEFAKCTLEDHLADATPVRAAELRSWFVQLFGALEYCNNREVVHGDIKPRNILMYILPRSVPETLCARLGDFDVASGPGDEFAGKYTVGTEGYRAPEVYYYKHLEVPGWGPPSDVWSMGVVLYRCTNHGVYPFAKPHSTGTSIICRVGQPACYRKIMGMPRAFPVRAYYPRPLNTFHEVINGCLDPDPLTRHTAAELVVRLDPH